MKEAVLSTDRDLAGLVDIGREMRRCLAALDRLGLHLPAAHLDLAIFELDRIGTLPCTT